jgi:hypothetical protein
MGEVNLDRGGTPALHSERCRPDAHMQTSSISGISEVDQDVYGWCGMQYKSVFFADKKPLKQPSLDKYECAVACSFPWKPNLMHRSGFSSNAFR